jgi:hypothetical protein
MRDPVNPSETATGPVLFAEPGSRWRVVAYGPLLCLVVLIVELVTGSAVHWLTLPILAALLAAGVSVQVVAARRHTSVELTATTLRNGTETIELGQIVEVLPPREERSWDAQPWETARSLGELTDVPRRRDAVGLKLRDGMLVRAWARDDATLRAELVGALGGSGDQWPSDSPENGAEQ